MDLITVLVVDDSAFMRKVISDIINSDPLLLVVGTARNGHEALIKSRLHNPDVVTLDIEMPEMDGLATLEILMSTNPLPVVMLSNLTQVGAEATIRALQLGAVDFIAKPSGQISLDIDKLSDEIIRKIKVAASASVKPQKTGNVTDLSIIPNDVSLKTEINKDSSLNKLIVIGTSTGGPKALNQVLPGIPADIDAAILIVQHMPAGFTKSLAERLNSISQIKVKEAEDGETILTGCAYIAPGDYHLRVERTKLSDGPLLLVKLGQEPPRGGHRPSVDEMLFSVAEQFWGEVVGVIMTGMGQDGTAGLKSITDQGAQIIAEHQSTCVVYGMPKAAIESGNVNQVVPLSDITATILTLI